MISWLPVLQITYIQAQLLQAINYCIYILSNSQSNFILLAIATPISVCNLDFLWTIFLLIWNWIHFSAWTSIQRNWMNQINNICCSQKLLNWFYKFLVFFLFPRDNNFLWLFMYFVVFFLYFLEYLTLTHICIKRKTSFFSLFDSWRILLIKIYVSSQIITYVLNEKKSFLSRRQCGNVYMGKSRHLLLFTTLW